MKIMYCHDGTENAQQALDKAIRFFKALKPEVILICVAHDILDASLEDETITNEYQAECSAIMRKAAERVAENGLDVDVMMATGDPRKMILGAIEKKSPDVVVIARKERSAQESVFHKSVSAYLVKNAGCDLLIMGPA